MILIDDFLIYYVAAYWFILYANYFTGDDQEDKPIPIIPDDLSKEVMISCLDNGILGRENLKLFGVRTKTLNSFYRTELNKRHSRNQLLSIEELQKAELNKAANEKFTRVCKESVRAYYFKHNV